MYPFDTQVCKMEFASNMYLTKLVPDVLEINPNISLDRYTVSKVQMCQTPLRERGGLVVEVTLGRPIISNILTVFIPTLTLLAISFIARFFVLDFFDLTIMVNLTILLVLATL